MHTGKINKLIRDRGFGFISATDGREIFFHKNSLVGVEFESLKGEEEVEFEVEKSSKGPCATNVSIAKKEE